jgi:subtilase family serine protease
VHSLIRPVTLFLTFSVSLSAFSQTKAPSRITRAIDERETVVLQGNLRPQLRAAVDQGRMDGGQRLRGVSMVFKRSAAQEAALDKLLAEQQDSSSANYHKWLTPEQYADRFGLNTADVATVTSWLQAQGFTVDRVARGRTQVWFSGPISKIETVFRTEMHRYSFKGESHFANGTELAVPAALADVVLGIHNLDDFRPRARVQTRRVPSHDVKANFTSNLSGGHFLIPADFATIYNVTPLYTATPIPFDGTGQKLVVVGQSQISTTDIDGFRSAAGLPARTLVNFQQVVVPGSGSAGVLTQGDTDESSLDLEWAEGIAKGVTEVFVFTGINNGNMNVFDSLQHAVDQNLAPVISMSYGNCEQNLGTFVTTMKQTAQQANAQGQTIVAASGDFGAADCDTAPGLPAQGGLGVDIPAALPYVTGIGGTEFSGDAAATVDPNNASCYLATPYWSGSCSLTSGGSALKYIPETTWNDTVLVNQLSAGGGGASTVFSKPNWQTGTGVPDDGARDVPDIALAAGPNHDGYLLCSSGSCVNGFRDSAANNNTLNVAGGTSFGAPAFAGIVAILNQKTASTGQGNINSTLYSIAATTTSAFHDIMSGNNIVPCDSTTPDCPTTGTAQYGYSAGAGYDLVTGLGSIDADVLLNAWSSANPTAADYTIFANVVSIAAAGQSGTSTITVDARNGFSGSVSFACTAPTSAQIACSVNGSPITLGGGTNSGTATLTITTTAAQAGLDPQNAPLWLGSSGALLAGVFLFGVTADRKRWTIALTLLMLAMVISIVGCGGSGSSTPKNAGTPAGSYTVTVSGSSSTTSHSTSVSVTVL